jgi:hypothetical protein
LDPPNKGARTIVRNAPTDIVRDEIDETRRWPPRRAAPSMGRDESIRAAPTKSLLGLVDPPLPREAETLLEGKDVHLVIQRHFTLHFAIFWVLNQESSELCVTQPLLPGGGAGLCGDIMSSQDVSGVGISFRMHSGGGFSVQPDSQLRVPASGPTHNQRFSPFMSPSGLASGRRVHRVASAAVRSFRSYEKSAAGLPSDLGGCRDVPPLLYDLSSQALATGG